MAAPSGSSVVELSVIEYGEGEEEARAHPLIETTLDDLADAPYHTLGPHAPSPPAAAARAARLVVPDSPPGEVDPALAEKFERLRAKAREGYSVNEHIRKAKSFRNPNILDNLVFFFGVRERGTNFPSELYDPDAISPDDSYIKIEEQRRAWVQSQTRREGDTVDFVAGAAGSAAAQAAPSNKGRILDGASVLQPAAKRQA